MNRRQRVLPAIVAASIALVVSAWAWHFLALDRVGDIDTAHGLALRTLPLPSDGGGVSQSFASPSGGAGEACTPLTATHDEPTPVVLQVHASVDERPGPVLARRVSTVKGMEQQVCISLDAIPTDVDRLWLTVRTASGTRGAVFTHATMQDAYPDGQLVAGDREVWGDLALRVTAPGTTRLRRPDLWPTGVPRVTTAVDLALLLATSSAIAVALALLVALTAQTKLGSITTLSVGVLVGLGVRVLSVPPEPSPPGAPTVEGRALIDELWAADVRTTWPRLGQAVAVQESRIGGTPVRALLALPSSEVRWRITVDTPLSLDTGVTLREEAWSLPGDGAGFTIAVHADDLTQVIWAAHVDPFFDPSARAWRDITIRLDPYVGRTVILSFRTDPGPHGNAVRDAAMWREPILRPSRPPR